MKFGNVLKIMVIMLVISFSISSAQIIVIPIAQVPIAGKSIPKYVEPLPHFAGLRVTGNDLTVTMNEVQQMVLPATFYQPLPPAPPLPPPYNLGTYVWGYDVDGSGTLYPGFTVEAQRGTPTTMTYVNNLVAPVLQDYLLIDQTLHWANPIGPVLDPLFNAYQGPVPTVVHLHGGEVPSEYDGGPDQWFTPSGEKGLGYRSSVAGQGNAATYVYPNDQDGATLWFHDHTLGATRLNVYAGLAAFYFLRDPLLERPDLPGGLADGTVTETNHFLGAAQTYSPEIEIVIQDRMFDTNGQLYFPNIGINPEHPFWIPEFLGDVIVVNGKTWPFLEVEPRRYRFRFLNGSNARFYNIWLQDMISGLMGPTIWQIGSDGGLLDIPAAMPTLLMGPGERFDLVIDFALFAGQTLTVRNNARSPYPKGTTADPQTVGQIMQFRVGLAVTGGADASYDPSTLTSPRLIPITPIPNPPALTRKLTLNEVMGAGGPLEVLVNNTKWAGHDPNGDPIQGLIPDAFGNVVTELPQDGSTEMWQIINITADAHPIHLHLIQFQLVSRQKFNVNKYVKAYDALFPGGIYGGVTYLPGTFIPAFGPPLSYSPATAGAPFGGNPDITPFLQGPARLPAANETGWKDTFIMYPGQVTTILARWTQQDGTIFPFDATGNIQIAFDQNGALADGPGYVWHCHIIDHEDNEMMRPYKVSSVPQPIAFNPPIAAALESALPTNFELNQNYPNPFNPTTEIKFALPEDSYVQLKIYNGLGQEVATLIDGNAPAGFHNVKLDGGNLASGIYFYKIDAGKFSQIKKMMLIK